MTSPIPPLSILDLALIGKGQSVGEALRNSVRMAQQAEARGYRRVWYAEHHNMSSIGSSATSVLIAHVATQTSTIRLGSGGVMLPNHSPLTIAEQFGTLAELHPGRIDLGLGRAPGTDQITMRALRRNGQEADHFPQDVQELQGYLNDDTRVSGVNATPGRGTHVPLYILGSSLFGASLAAALGLPYAFASHFAPEALEQAAALYRERFSPSEQCSSPHLIAALNVIAADTDDEAQAQLVAVRRMRAARMLARGRDLSEPEIDALLASPQGQYFLGMMRYTAVGTPKVVGDYLTSFAEHAGADELMVVHASPGIDARLRSLDLLADAAELAPVG
ncbi:MAG: LLM class flavin-dependent oxidoreductase [Acidimicrobiales bacterium]|nr:LLM class flavin-dependent oxidoreductase [Acidimicrobiales bacterium]